MPWLRVSELTYQQHEADSYFPIYKDDGTGAYAGPHWKDNSATPNGDADDPGDNKWPVAYVRDKTMKVQVKIVIDQNFAPPAGRIKVRGENTTYDDYKFQANSDPGQGVTINGSTITLTTTCSQKFPDHIDHFDTFNIKWEVSFNDGADWIQAGTTKNQVYVLWAKPVFAHAQQKLFHTLAHNGTLLAKGKTVETDVIAEIWEDFEDDRQVRQVVPPHGATPGRLLSYYQDRGAIEIDTLGLLSTGDGQCNAWVHLFIDLLRAQGIDQHQWIEITPTRACNALIRTHRISARESPDICA